MYDPKWAALVSLREAAEDPSDENLKELRDDLLLLFHMEQCPTLCDYDCLDMCHEGHQIPQKRDHDPKECEYRRGLTHD